MTLDLGAIRAQFPALQRQAIFFDNPGGTQVARQSIDRMVSYLTHHNANHGGAFPTSIESDRILDEAHAAAADFINAADPAEIVFGQNMTTLTLHISRSLARLLQKGDKIVVTRLDHDANISPWVLMAEDRGCEVIWVEFDTQNGTLNLDSMQAALEQRPRLVAVGYASNALGTVNPVKQVVEMAHAVGALVYIDAVQYAPHGPIDVQDLGCDFLAISAYKFFGPHMGLLYGRLEHLESLFPYKVRPAPKDPPGKFETGTQNHEGIAGVLGAIEYLEWVGQQFGSPFAAQWSGRFSGRRLHLKQAMSAIQTYELEVSALLLSILEETPGLTLYGLRDQERLLERVPTFSFTLQGKGPRQVAEQLAARNIFAWDGNYYALAVTQRLGVEDHGGMVRVGPVHYNTLEEVQRLGEALAGIAVSG
jgi:cysteine desulfurase family protein (TIGR01976 family)